MVRSIEATKKEHFGNCLICGQRIFRKSQKAKYCSSSCKYKAYRIRNPEKVKSSLEKYREQNHAALLEKWREYRIKSGRSKTSYTTNKINICLECSCSFHPKKFTPFQKYCSRSCRQKYISRKFYQQNPQKMRQYLKKYDSSEKRRAYRKSEGYIMWRKSYNTQWLKDNPEKTKEYSKKYADNHPEERKEQIKRYRHSLKGIFSNRKRGHIYRMLIKKNYDHNRLVPILDEQDNKCPLCNTKYTENLVNMELGHIFPMKKYPILAADVENIIPICKRCNRRMRDKIFIDYCIEHNLGVPKRVLDYVQKQKLMSQF